MRFSSLIRAGGVAVVAGIFVASGPPARAMGAEPFIGSIGMFAGNYAPQGWATCDGQLMQVTQNQALFSILGTTYGGDGRTTFALPDLRGRVPVHAGQGKGLKPYKVGETGGAESRALTVAEMPTHTHALNAFDGAGTTDKPAGASIAVNAGAKQYAAAAPNVAMSAAPAPAAGAAAAAGSIGPTGTGTAFDTRPPFLCITFCIATAGMYPTRE